MIKTKYVTDIVKSLQPFKDWKKIADKHAIKYNKMSKKTSGVDPETTGQHWLDTWELERKAAAKRGKLYHSKKEQEALGSPYAVVMSEDVRKKASKLELRDRDFLKLEEGKTYHELYVWLNSAKLVGQVDEVTVKDNKLNIIDHKSFKELKKKAYENWEGKKDNLKHPCEHLDNCNFVTSSLQINLYAYILKRLNPKLKIGKLQINYLNFDEFGKFVGEEIHDCLDLQKECKVIIKLIKEGKL